MLRKYADDFFKINSSSAGPTHALQIISSSMGGTPASTNRCSSSVGCYWRYYYQVSCSALVVAQVSVRIPALLLAV